MQRFLTEEDELSTLEEDISIIQEEYEKIESNSRLVITKEGVEASLIDVGVGISQVLPVVVACLNNVKTLISLEQPELHIHPAFKSFGYYLLIASPKIRLTRFRTLTTKNP